MQEYLFSSQFHVCYLLFWNGIRAYAGTKVTWGRITESVSAAADTRRSSATKRTWISRERNSACWAWAECNDSTAGYWQTNTKKTLWKIPQKSSKTIKSRWMQKCQCAFRWDLLQLLMLLQQELGFFLFSFSFGVAHTPFTCQRWGLPHSLAQCATQGKGLV